MIYLQLYLIVLKTTLMSFGGAYSIWALMDRELVVTCDRSVVMQEPAIHCSEMKAGFCLCREEFNTIFGIGEVLPGPQINAIAILAFSKFGLAGMLVMIAALVSPGLLLLSLFGEIQYRLKSSSLLRIFFSGAAMSSVAILSVFFINMVLGLVGKMDFGSIICLLFTGAAFWASFRLRVNPLLIVAIAATAGYALL